MIYNPPPTHNQNAQQLLDSLGYQADPLVIPISVDAETVVLEVNGVVTPLHRDLLGQVLAHRDWLTREPPAFDLEQLALTDPAAYGKLKRERRQTNGKTH